MDARLVRQLVSSLVLSPSCGAGAHEGENGRCSRRVQRTAQRLEAYVTRLMNSGVGRSSYDPYAVVATDENDRDAGSAGGNCSALVELTSLVRDEAHETTILSATSRLREALSAVKGPQGAAQMLQAIISVLCKVRERRVTSDGRAEVA